jgi:regulator of RNase E activity RraB
MKILFLISLFSCLMGCSTPEKNIVQTDPDQQVIDHLSKAGSDLNTPHKIDFYLYFPSEDKAKQAAADMKKEGLDVEVRRGATGTDWLCLGRKEMAPQHSELLRLRRTFEVISKRFDGEYDGWETEVKRK